MYHGIDSPEKKWARMTTWNLIAETLGPKKFLPGPHLVLAGPEAADVGFLLIMGVKPHNIVIVDKEAAFLERAQQRWRKYSGLNFRLHNVSQMHDLIKTLPAGVFSDGPPKFASIFLDFDKPLSDWLIGAIQNNASCGLRDNGVLAVNVLKGREVRGSRVHADLVKLKQEDPHLENGTRLVLLWQALTAQPGMANHWLMPWGIVLYDSSEKDRKGSPMYTMLFTHELDLMGRKGKKRTKAMSAAMQKYRGRQVTMRAPADTRNPEWMRASVVRNRYIPTAFISSVFNLPKGRVAAWRAWATMDAKAANRLRRIAETGVPNEQPVPPGAP